MNQTNNPLVVIFGRTNVGKSTLFNCLTEKKSALVSKIEGTTRDSNIGTVDWQRASFDLVDTGGLLDFGFLLANQKKQKQNRRSADIDIKVQQQARDFLNKADLILFLTDARAGLLPQDKEMALKLKKIKKTSFKKNVEIILAVNKVDSPEIRKETAEFNKLNLGEPILISAANGSGTGDLLDTIVSKLPKNKIKKKSEEALVEKKSIIKVSIIGKPNVGKSSLLNALIGENRMIVSPQAHTTRESKNALIKYNDSLIEIIDTAGISKSGQKNTKKIKLEKTLEKSGIAQSLRAISQSDISLLVVDIDAGITHQESKLFEEISKRKNGLIIVANKWDLIEEKDTKKYTKAIYADLPFATWTPIIFCSALDGTKIKKIPDLILEINENYHTEISENALSKFLNKIVKKHAPKKAKGTKHPYIYSLKQIRSAPPKFKIKIGAKDTIHFSYVRFIENRLREKFGFKGVPITIIIEKSRLIHGKHTTHNTYHTAR
ncbi:ribosome biogenesis GTPase Der, partial [Candidatus Parcubacteria bacterium]|nr:ribosome biogenesis GTPase Der [Candidatus Parcubacteria bacterium]